MVETDKKQPVYIIVGRQGSGKTTFLKKLIVELQLKKIKVGGFIAEGYWKDDIRFGFNLIGIQDSISISLCTKESVQGYLPLGNFHFNPEAIKMGNEIIARDQNQSDIIILDEIGIFELEEKVWFDAFKDLLQSYLKPVLISVREKILTDVIEKFKLQHICVFSADDDIKDCCDTIISNLENK